MLALLQEQLDRLKTEASKTVEQLQQAKAKLEAAEKDLNSSRQSAYEDSQATNKEKQEMHNTITNLQVSSTCSPAVQVDLKLQHDEYCCVPPSVPGCNQCPAVWLPLHHPDATSCCHTIKTL